MVCLPVVVKSLVLVVVHSRVLSWFGNLVLVVVKTYSLLMILMILMISIVLWVCLELGQINTLEYFFREKLLKWIGVPNSQIKQRVEVILPEFLLVITYLFAGEERPLKYIRVIFESGFYSKFGTPSHGSTPLSPWTWHFFWRFFPLLHHFSGQKIRDHPVPTILIQIFFLGMNIQHFWCDNRTAWLDPRELGVSGFLGGMGGNAMIGLSTINVLNGGRGRMAPTLWKTMGGLGTRKPSKPWDFYASHRNQLGL